MATSFKPSEIMMLKRILDRIFLINNVSIYPAQGIVSSNQPKDRRLSVTSMEVINNLAKDENLNLHPLAVQNTLRDLVDLQWLKENKPGRYILTNRALIELEKYLLETYNDDGDNSTIRILKCYACQSIITLGKICSKNCCHFALHTPCAEKYFVPSRAKECAVCKTP